ncbi:FRG domain-containing protein [Paracoccus yeei]|uniref:FRG domain-containing protein n=1 Tax=Paracoccus yeei TaxID=147645 RepID=A0A2D2BY68_9RHOB|nr:FRG domain-containing protein [Paracoccus yeei]ATQ55197.1 hypothetical protein PYTT13_04850 [Paracoccus yeei]
MLPFGATYVPQVRFDGLTSALAYFKNSYPAATFRHLAIDPDTKDRFEVDIPQWLFRGEAGTWPRTASSMERIQSLKHGVFASMPENVRSSFARALEAISIRATNELAEWFGLGTMQAAGFAQHYGLPTEFLDVTASLDVAVAFAIDDPKGWTAPKIVSFAVLDMRQAIDRCVVADLGTLVQIARRPAIQSAYGLFHKSHRDLKDPVCISEVGLHWYEVIIHPQEAICYTATPNLLDAHKDQVAGAVQLILDDLAKVDGKWPDPIALFLSQNVAAAPFVARVTQWRGGQPEVVEIVSAEDAGQVFKEAEIRDYSRRLWSRDYPDVTSRY